MKIFERNALCLYAVNLFDARIDQLRSYSHISMCIKDVRIENKHIDEKSKNRDTCYSYTHVT
jgi:hypothetical protein